jgi:excisionase family DNA binding protein
MADKILKPGSLRYSLMKSALLKRETNYVDLLSQDRMLGVRETSQVLGCSQETVRRLGKAGIIPAVRFSPKGYLRFRSSVVQDFLQKGVPNA